MSQLSRYDKLVEDSHELARADFPDRDNLLAALTYATLAVADAVHRLALSRGAF